MDELKERTMDCLSVARSVEQNVTAVRLGLKRTLDSLTAGVTALQKEPLLGERLAKKMGEMMAQGLVEMSGDVMVRTMDFEMGASWVAM